MIVTNQIADADAFVAAWLPGTEGEGVADVLFGDYPFTGKLSFSWPSSMSQIPINIGDSNYNPLFAFGYGLGPVDLEVFCNSWLKVPGDLGYDSRANLYGDPSGIVNFDDFAVFASEWNPPSSP